MSWGVQRSDGKWVTEPNSDTPKTFKSEMDANYEAGKLCDAAEVYNSEFTFSVKEL